MSLEAHEEPPLPGAVKAQQSVTADWSVLRPEIDGVELIEVRNVLRDSGHVTEVLRAEWFAQAPTIDQVFQTTLEAGALSAWHAHLRTTDRLFVTSGQVKIVLFDARPDSSTRGRVAEFRLGERRPGLVIVPPGVWHGIKNLHARPSTVLNIVDRAYEYDDPDHWRLPPDAPQIPYVL